MKKLILSLLLLFPLLSFAQWSPAVNNYGSYNIYNNLWVKNYIRINYLKNPARTDTLLLTINNVTGQIDTFNVKNLPGGSGSVSKWTLSGVNLYPNSTTHNVAIGTTDANGSKFVVNGIWNINDGYVKYGSGYCWVGKFSGLYGRYAGNQTYLNGMLDESIGGRRHVLFMGYISDTLTLYSYTHGRIALSIDTTLGVDITAANIPNRPNLGIHISCPSLSASKVIESDITMDTVNTEIASRKFNSLSQNNSKSWWVTPTGVMYKKHPYTGAETILFRIDTSANVILTSPLVVSTDSVLVMKGGKVCSMAFSSFGGGSASYDSIPIRRVSNTIFAKSSASFLIAGTTGSTPASGAGTRLMWIPSKGAFSAGVASGAFWDDSNIGLYSTRLGSGGYATNTNSVSLGTGRANGESSLAGSTCRADGLGSTALTYSAEAYGQGALAIAYSTATGNYSLSHGYGNDAKSYFEIAMGLYGVNASGSATTWVSTDNLFRIGNGTGTGASANNAFTVLKNGTTYIGDRDAATDPILTVSVTDSTATFKGEVKYAYPHGFMAFKDSAVLLSVAQNVWTKINNASNTLWGNIEMDYITKSADSLIITRSGDYYMMSNLRFHATNNKNFRFAVFKNGVEQWHTSVVSLGAGTTQQLSLQYYFVGAAKGDRISFRITNTTDGSDPTIVGGSVYIKKEPE